MKSNKVVLFSLAILGSILKFFDIATTYYGIKVLGVAREANPIANFFIKILGLELALIFIYCLCIYLFVVCVKKNYFFVLIFVVVIHIIVVCNNFIVIGGIIP